MFFFRAVWGPAWALKLSRWGVSRLVLSKAASREKEGSGGMHGEKEIISTFHHCLAGTKGLSLRLRFLEVFSGIQCLSLASCARMVTVDLFCPIAVFLGIRVCANSELI